MTDRLSGLAVAATRPAVMAYGRMSTQHAPFAMTLVAAMYAVAGVLTTAAGLWRLGEGDVRPVYLAVAAACTLVAACAWVTRERAPTLAVHVLLLVAGLGSTLAYAAAGPPVLAASVGYAFPVLAGYVACFFTPRAAQAHTAGLGVGVAVGAASNHVGPWSAGVTVTILLAVSFALQRLMTRLRGFVLTDALTGLGNRVAMHTAVDRAVEVARTTGAPLTAVVLDLDGFKAVNDTLGHSAGDDLLVRAARAWRSCLRGGQRMFRTGGDEFVLLLPGADLHAARDVLGCLRAADPVGWTAGLATYPADGCTSRELIDRADQQLIARKRARPPARRITDPAPADVERHDVAPMLGAHAEACPSDATR